MAGGRRRPLREAGRSPHLAPRAIDAALGREQRTESVDELLAEQQEEGATGETEPDDSANGSTATTTTTMPVPEVRTPTPAEPLRLYVGGDSMASEFSKSMERVAATTGVIQSTLDPRVSTGLTRPDYFNWPAHLVNDILPTEPEVMVMMFGANDARTSSWRTARCSNGSVSRGSRSTGAVSRAPWIS
ncbi:MAG: hypothetical protein U5R31_01935 [Acidimicrobiia bacterium]|nr:hypothetical protein [Acidimicrobiia bacterium]